MPQLLREVCCHLFIDHLVYFFLLDLNNNSLKYTTPLSLQPTSLATLVLFSMNTLPSQTKSLHFLNPATITFVNFAVFAHISTSKQPPPLPPPLSILNLITVTLSITTFQTINLTGSNRSRTLLLVLLLRLLNPHITPILKSLHWLKINERVEYKLLSLTYKVLTTSQPSYLHNLIVNWLYCLTDSVQPPRSTRSSSVVTLSRPPTISLKITDRLFRYASPRLWNKLPDSFRQPRQSSLDSPPHSLVISSLLSSDDCKPSCKPLIIHHSYTLSLQAQNLPLQQILSTLDFLTYRTAFMTMGLDRTYHAHRFIFSFTF